MCSIAFVVVKKAEQELTIRIDACGVQRSRFSSYFSLSVLERLSVVACA